ncbi:hypothetical protein ACIB24_20600 [Spongisporangium articulatum]|uniref:Flp pilus assembly protein CpaB n=1 Tax=Spongisporangium articulatum TaxID=3362603 RepID=A0ABW8AV13_9ACTN
MKRRALLLTLSLLVALLGTVLVGLYVKGADDRAQEGQEMVRVLVATRLIPKGTTATAAAPDMVLTDVPKSSLTYLKPFTVNNAGALQKMGGSTTLIDIREGAPISETYFSAPQSGGATGASAATDDVTFVFPLDPAPRATGVIGAGDSVTILVTHGDKTGIFIKKALVYAVNGTPAGDNDATGAANSIAVTVSLLDAERVINAQARQWKLYIVKPANPDSVRELGPVTNSNVLDNP